MECIDIPISCNRLYKHCDSSTHTYRHTRTHTDTHMRTMKTLKPYKLTVSVALQLFAATYCTQLELTDIVIWLVPTPSVN